jgi:hypothetical protein
MTGATLHNLDAETSGYRFAEEMNSILSRFDGGVVDLAHLEVAISSAVEAVRRAGGDDMSVVLKAAELMGEYPDFDRGIAAGITIALLSRVV